MPPKPQPRDAFELFQSHFDQLLNPAHELDHFPFLCTAPTPLDPRLAKEEIEE